MSKTITIVRTRRKGSKWYRLHDDGREELLPDPGLLPGLTEEEIYAAARSDPDNPPREDYPPGRLKRVPQVKVMRRALGLTQEEFSARFRIPLGTLRDWEQGKSKPDQAARAYLTVIARNPTAAVEALKAAPRYI
ncbi:MAG: helix-turn-helix domain-containing protein [Hyphomicrobiaceae bacterium]